MVPVPVTATQVPAAPTTIPATDTQVPAAPTTIPATDTQAPAAPTKVPATIKGPSQDPVNDPMLSSPAGSSTYGTSSILVVVDDDDSQDSVTWLKIDNGLSNDPQSKLILYKESRDSILKHTYWLHDSEIYAGQIFLKRHFPLFDGLHDPAITGPMVIPATSEFIQIVNIGAHWVCISTLGCQAGIVRVFSSLYIKLSSVAINHAYLMLHHPQNTVTFLNEKVQKQVVSSDCALFALAFTTDFCYGLDPTSQRYSQKEMWQHYVTCLESGAMVPFPKTDERVPFHLGCNSISVPIFCLCRLPKDRKEYVECFSCHGLYHPDCVSIPEWAIKSRLQWNCQKCRNTMAKMGSKNILAGA